MAQSPQYSDYRDDCFACGTIQVLLKWNKGKFQIAVFIGDFFAKEMFKKSKKNLRCSLWWKT